MKKIITKNNSRKQMILISVLGIAVLALITVMSSTLPYAIDWSAVLRPAVFEILHGRSPYNAEGFFNPPWTAILLIPFAVLPENLGRAIMILSSLVTYSFVAYRLGAKKTSIVFLLLSPPVLHVIINGNIDWLAALGFILPPQWGLFFVTIKPQIGIAVIPFWLIEAGRKGGLKLVIKTFSPVITVSALSFALFGLWPLKISHTLDLQWNASLWPVSIPVGLALFVAAIRKRKIEYSMAASPCLSPYVALHSWIGTLLAIVSSVPETIAAVVGLWLVVILRLVA